MKINQELINKLKNGHIAIDNTGNPNVELLKAVLKEAFPGDTFTKGYLTGNDNYYYFDKNIATDWKSSKQTINLPTIPLNDFLEKEFVLPEKWCVLTNVVNEFEILKNYVKSLGYQYADGYNIMTNKGFYTYKPTYYTEITFEQFKEYVLKEKPMKEQFPKDDFGVIVENNNGKEIIDYLHNKGFIKTGWDGSGTLYNYGVRKDSKDIIYTSSNAFSKTYTLQQLKNLENNMENKEIIGYKLIKPEYEKAAREIAVGCFCKFTEIFQEDVKSIGLWKEAGVLDIWFEPVYKSKEVVIKMGNLFDLIVKDGKVWHKSDNITQFVQNLVNCFDYVNKDQSYGQYKAQFKDVIFSSTGCERTETKLSEWILVYNELQKQK